MPAGVEAARAAAVADDDYLEAILAKAGEQCGRDYAPDLPDERYLSCEFSPDRFHAPYAKEWAG